MQKQEFRAAVALAAVFSVRLLGLFMIYPVFAAYARNLSGATPYLIGEALGIYGLSQGLLQIPFGVLSDRVGRKVMIAFGLLLFAAGSAIAALATSIGGVIIGAGGRSDGGGKPHQGHGAGRHHHRRFLHDRAGRGPDRR
jgi:MFS family permease